MKLWPWLLLLTAPLVAQVLVQHDYDPVSDSVVSWRLEPGRSVTQSLTLPVGAAVTGVRVKVQRSGSPRNLSYRLGTTRGGTELASGDINASHISPWFEHWVDARFRTPVQVPRHTKLFLTLSLPPGSPGACEIYGTSTASIDRREFRPRFQYTENWYAPTSEPTRFENPANIDYGTRTPEYAGGMAFDETGKELPSLDLAFQFYGTKPPHADGEERFAFIDSITGPLYGESLRNPVARPVPGEIVIGPEWRVRTSSESPVVGTAVREFGEFLGKAMGVKPGPNPKRTIHAAVGCGAPPAKEEGFDLRVAPDRVDVCGIDERGTMRGLHFLEARMKLRRAPFLMRGTERRAPAQSPRITSAPFYSKLELEAPIDQYTNGLLGRISRAGFNAIWVWGDLDEVAHSDVYPELDRDVSRRQQRLNELVSRAARYGIDVVLYLANRPLPEWFYRKHPGVRGSELHAYGGVNILCTSVPEVRRHLASAARDLTSHVPGLKGIVYIVGGEGFMHCYTRKNTCPRCSQRSPQETIAEFSQSLLEGARAGNPAAAVVLWPYSASNTWSKGDITQSKLIERLPRGITLLTEFAKEGTVSFGGVSIPAYDYPISLVGPSERFVEQARLARERGLGLWVKTEHAIALEFVQTPYIPAFFQWAERFDRVRDSAATGVFANWMHYGFTPSIAADVFYWSMWDTSMDPAQMLAQIARQHFGEGAETAALQAWKAFSEAIREYPFSSPVAMGPVQTGPSHPLFLDAAYRPAHGTGRQFKNDLGWTKPWEPDLAIAQFSKMEALWAAGIPPLEQVVRCAPPELRRDAERELGIARALLATLRSTIHVARFYQLREQLLASKDIRLLDEMTAIARAELRNAQDVVPIVEADSRLGYANSGKNDQTGVPRAGIYSPGSIRKKIAQVERLLAEEIPAYRRTLQ